MIKKKTSLHRPVTNKPQSKSLLIEPFVCQALCWALSLFMASFNPPPKHPGAHLKDEETGSETFTGVKEDPDRVKGKAGLLNAQLSSLPCTCPPLRPSAQPPRAAGLRTVLTWHFCLTPPHTVALYKLYQAPRASYTAKTCCPEATRLPGAEGIRSGGLWVPWGLT